MTTAARVPEHTPLREDMGGARLLDRRVLIWLVPTAVLTSVLTRDPADVRDATAWVMVNLASLVLVWLWVELLRAVAVPDRTTTPAPVAFVVLIGASIGFVKATTTSIFGWTAGVLPLLMPAAEWWRALGTTVQGAFLIPVLTLAVATLDRYRTEYDRLVAERARTALLDADGDGAPPEDVERARLIAGFVGEARRRLSDAEERTVATVLERLVEERLRPMTRELWSARDIGTDFRARSLLRSALVANPLPILPVALVYAATSFASRAQTLAPAANAVQTVAAVAVIVMVFGVARRVRPTGARWAPLHLTVTLVATAALQTWGVEGLIPDELRWRPLALFVSVLVWISALTLLSGAAAVALRGGERVSEELLRAVDVDAADGAVALASQRLRDREIADHLHSSLQNRLIAAAHRIAASSERDSVVREELDAIELLLGDLAAGVVADAGASGGAREQFADVVARWDGFVTITSQLGPIIDYLPPSMQDRVAQVLVEAVNNAVRHGRAAEVDVRLVRTGQPGAFLLTVDDDGVGPVLHDPGLGSALFDAVSGGDWTLEPRATGGSRLRLTLLLSPTG